MLTISLYILKFLQDVFADQDAETFTEESNEDHLQSQDGLQNQFGPTQNSFRLSESTGYTRPVTSISFKVSSSSTYKDSASPNPSHTICSLTHGFVRSGKKCESSLFETEDDTKKCLKPPSQIDSFTNSKSDMGSVCCSNIERCTIAASLTENPFGVSAISKKADDLKQDKSAPFSISTFNSESCTSHAITPILCSSNTESHTMTSCKNLASFATQEKNIKRFENSLWTAEEIQTKLDDLTQAKDSSPPTLDKCDDIAFNMSFESSITDFDIGLYSNPLCAESAPSITEEIGGKTSQKTNKSSTVEKTLRNNVLLDNDELTKNENLKQDRKKRKRPSMPASTNKIEYASKNVMFPLFVEPDWILFAENSAQFVTEETKLEQYSSCQSFSRHAESFAVPNLLPFFTLEGEVSSWLSDASFSERTVFNRDEGLHQGCESLFCDSDKKISTTQPIMESVNVASENVSKSRMCDSVIKPHFIALNEYSAPSSIEETKTETTEKTDFASSITKTSLENGLPLGNELLLNGNGLKQSGNKKKMRKKQKSKPSSNKSNTSASETNINTSNMESLSVMSRKNLTPSDTEETKPQSTEKSFLFPVNEASLKGSSFPEEEMNKNTIPLKQGKRKKAKKRKKSKTPSSINRSDNATSESLCESNIGFIVGESHPSISNKDSISFGPEKIEPDTGKQTNITGKSVFTETSLKDSSFALNEMLKKTSVKTSNKPGKKKKARKRKCAKAPPCINKSDDDVSEIKIFSFDILPTSITPSKESLYSAKTSVTTGSSAADAQKAVDNQKQIGKKKVKRAATSDIKSDGVTSANRNCHFQHEPSPCLPHKVSIPSVTKERKQETSKITKNTSIRITTNSKNTSSSAEKKKNVDDSTVVSKKKALLSNSRSGSNASKSVSAPSICRSNNQLLSDTSSCALHRALSLSVSKATKQKTNKQIKNFTINTTTFNNSSSTEMRKTCGDLKSGKNKKLKNVPPSTSNPGNTVCENKIRSSSTKPPPYRYHKSSTASATKSKPEVSKETKSKFLVTKTNLKTLSISAEKQKIFDNSKPGQKKNTSKIINSANAASKNASVSSICNFNTRSPSFTSCRTSTLSTATETKSATNKQPGKSHTMKRGSFSTRVNRVQAYDPEQDREIKVSNVQRKPDGFASTFAPAPRILNSNTGTYSMIARKDSAPTVAKESKSETIKKASTKSTTNRASLKDCSCPVTLLAMILKQEKLHVNILYARAQLQKNFFADIKDLLTFVDAVDQFIVTDCWVKCKI